MAARTWYHIWECAQLFIPSKHLTVRGKRVLRVELEMIHLGTSKGRRSRHCDLYGMRRPDWPHHHQEDSGPGLSGFRIPIITIRSWLIWVHVSTIVVIQAADYAGKSQLVTCSPYDPIVYLSFWILDCKSQHHDSEASWHLVAVATQKIRFKLWSRPMLRFQPPWASCEALRSTCHMHTASPPMIPPVQMIPVWGRARSSLFQRESWTGPDHRLAVLHWTVWRKSRIRRSRTAASVGSYENGGFVSRSVGRE